MKKNTYELIYLKDQSFTKNNVYIIANILTQSAALIDPACDLSQIVQALLERNISLDKILLTHSHSDHVRRVNDLVELYDCDVYISKLEADYYFYESKNLHYFNDGDTLSIGDTDIKCILTPGHTVGSTCFQVEDRIFTGDTVFIEGCGVCTGIGGSVENMFQSIQRIKNTVGMAVKVYPAHTYGALPGCPMEYVRHNNIYFNFERRQFVEFRMRKNQTNLFNFK